MLQLKIILTNNLGDKMRFDSLTVLFVDDEQEIRDLMQNVLSFEVKKVVVAQDGEEAYKLYKEIKPDIIFSDYHMPKMNGIDFIRKVRQNDRTTRVIMLTAHSDVDVLLKATELHLTKYLLKPTTGDALFEALRIAAEEIKNFNTVTKNLLILKDDFTWDVKEQILFNGSKEVHLTPKEKKILDILLSNPNCTITYEMLMDEAWENYDNYSIDTIKTMIKNLRKKIPKDLIRNVYGTGFKAEI